MAFDPSRRPLRRPVGLLGRAAVQTLPAAPWTVPGQTEEHLTVATVVEKADDACGSGR